MKCAKIVREKFYSRYEGYITTKIYKEWWYGGRTLIHSYEVYLPMSKSWHWLNYCKLNPTT